MATKKATAKKTGPVVAVEVESKPAKKAVVKKDVKSTAEPALVAPTRQEIELLAYHLWIQRGKEHSGDVQDWLEAEHHLKKR